MSENMVSINFIRAHRPPSGRTRCLNKINYNPVAWIEGTAILIAVIVVAGVGSFVDYKKEIQFVLSRHKTDEKNVVSDVPTPGFERFFFDTFQMRH